MNVKGLPRISPINRSGSPIGFCLFRSRCHMIPSLPYFLYRCTIHFGYDALKTQNKNENNTLSNTLSV